MNITLVPADPATAYAVAVWVMFAAVWGIPGLISGFNSYRSRPQKPRPDPETRPAPGTPERPTRPRPSTRPAPGEPETRRSVPAVGSPRGGVR